MEECIEVPDVEFSIELPEPMEEFPAKIEEEEARFRGVVEIEPLKEVDEEADADTFEENVSFFCFPLDDDSDLLPPLPPEFF